MRFCALCSNVAVPSLCPTFVSSTALRCPTPVAPIARAPPATVGVDVALNGRDFTPEAAQWAVLPHARVRTLLPARGPVVGNTTVLVRGDAFVDAGDALLCRFGEPPYNILDIVVARLVGRGRRAAPEHRQGALEAHTPRIDELIAGGIELERHYSFRICSPARCALQTGRHPLRVNAENTGVTAWNPDDPVSGYAGVPGRVDASRPFPRALNTDSSTRAEGRRHLASRRELWILGATLVPTNRSRTIRRCRGT